MVVLLPIAQADFTRQLQDSFTQALAAAAGIAASRIVIDSVVQSRRRAASVAAAAVAPLVITSEIAAESASSASALAARLTPEALNAALDREGLPAAKLRSVVVQSAAASAAPDSTALLAGSIAGGVGAALLLGGLAATAWQRRRGTVSRRLIGAKAGDEAKQEDLPQELRGKYQAERVLGCGAFGVVVEAWQLNNGRRGVRRALKLVHSQGRCFTAAEARRLDREVRAPPRPLARD